MKQAIEHVLAVRWGKRVTRHDRSHWRQWVGRALVAGGVQVRGEIIMTAVAIIGGDKWFESDAVVHGQTAGGFPTILNVGAQVGLTGIQKALCAAGETGWQSREKIRECEACPVGDPWN